MSAATDALIAALYAHGLPDVGKAFAAIVAEVDALRAQLDDMTTETTTQPKWVIDNDEMGFDSIAPREKGHYDFRKVTRLVGPWVEVE